jgi:hypothetical protein
MPFVSTTRHQERYVESPSTAQRLADIRTLLDSLQRLQVALPLKKKMLVHGIWQVSEATGSFYTRYRSEGVIRTVGVKIQRDHIYQKRTLVEQLLAPDSDLKAIIERARCCIVTKDEHDRLHQVDGGLDGWDRYRAAGVVVYDMCDETRVV